MAQTSQTQNFLMELLGLKLMIWEHARYHVTGCGTTTAALLYGGATSEVGLKLTEQWNGNNLD